MHVEVDRLLWQEGWKLTPTDIYERQHAEIIAGDDWVIDGLGQQVIIAERIARATDVILVDMPLWIHFWLAAERKIAWSRGPLNQAPGGISHMPPTKALSMTIWDVEQNWMPTVRSLCLEAERQGKTMTRLACVEDLDAFTAVI